MDAWDAAQRAKDPPKSYGISVADNLQMKPNHLQLGNTISAQQCFFRYSFSTSHLPIISVTELHQLSLKKCALWKSAIFQFERVIFLFVFVESSKTHSWKISTRNFKSLEKFLNNWLKQKLCVNKQSYSSSFSTCGGR